MGSKLPLSLPAYWILCGLLGATATQAFSAAPAGLNQQGLLLDTAGAPLDGAVDLAVRIWAHPTSTLLADLSYLEDHLATPVVDGVYSIEIGAGSSPSGPFSAALFASPDRWLELVVNGEVMTPRQRLLSVAYALQAEICADAATLGGLTSANIIASAQSSIPFTNLTGLIADAQVPASFTRDAEVIPLVLAGDGPGSGLNADLLDGLSSGSFSQLGPTIESVEITDLTVATIDIANLAVTAAKLSDGAGSGVDADLLDGLSSSSFLRGDISTNFTGTFFTTASTSTMNVNGTLSIGQSSDGDNDEILFDQANESLTWNNLGSRFEISDELRADAFSLTTPLTRSVRIPGSAFTTDASGDLWVIDVDAGAGKILSGTATYNKELSATVNLPTGATITQLSCSRYNVGSDSDLGQAVLVSRSTPSSTRASLTPL